MTADQVVETVSEELGPITAGPFLFSYREHRWSDRGDLWPPQFELLAGLSVGRYVMTQRQGGLCEGDLGVDAHLDTDGYAVPPVEARRIAHALLAAADLADRLEHGDSAPAPRAALSIDRLLDEALNYLCDADNTAVMTAVPRDICDLLRHSIAEAVKRLELIEVGAATVEA